MQIADDTVVTFDYTLKDDAGEVIDASSEDGPMTYLHGHGQIVRGLEKALKGKKAGDELKVKVAPKDGYGEKSGGKPIKLSKKDLPADLEPEVGMGLASRDQSGRDVTLFVVAVNKDNIQLSLDHPLAGQTLHFDVTVRDVRAATKDEIAHGHAHGEDGHHHH